jgi:hypothetical protein
VLKKSELPAAAGRLGSPVDLGREDDNARELQNKDRIVEI